LPKRRRISSTLSRERVVFRKPDVLCVLRNLPVR
jgi:hypothetical protein